MLDNLYCVTDVTYYIIYHCCIICPHSIIQIHSYILADHSNLNAEVFTLAQKQALDLLRWGKQPATVHIVAKIFLNLHQLPTYLTKFLYLEFNFRASLSNQSLFANSDNFFRFLQGVQTRSAPK